MDNPGPAILKIIFLIAILVISAVISMAGTAFSSLNDSLVKDMEISGNKKAGKIRKFIDDERDFGTPVKVATTLLGFLLAAYTLKFYYPYVGHWFVSLLGSEGFAFHAASVLTVVLITLVVSYIFLLIGVLIPKRIAVQKSQKIASDTLELMIFLKALLIPFSVAVTVPAKLFVKITGYDPEKSEDDVTEEGILQIIDDGEEQGVIEESQKEMIANVIEFDDRIAADVMTHRTDVTAVEINDTIDEVLKIAIEDGYSRMPVYEDDLDNIKGILYVKDLLQYVGTNVPADFKIENVMREAMFVPESKKCRDLFSAMTEKHLQLVVVSDEYGGVAGIVTIEDLIEEIVGNIQDEFDNEQDDFEKINDDTFNVDGVSDIYEVSELLGIEFPEGEYETIAGYMMSVIGRIPEQDEHPEVVYGGYSFTIAKMVDRRIERVLVQKLPETDPDEKQSDKVKEKETEKN